MEHVSFFFQGCQGLIYMAVVKKMIKKFPFKDPLGVVRCGEGALMSPGHPADTGLQLGKACYPCSR